jgi:zinc protease
MRMLSLALVPALLVGAAPEAPGKRPFPFAIHQKTLANGLKVVVIPTGMPNLVSLQIPVSTGSRNEVEPGKSGFAHFFEHMMFRGTKTVSPEQWNQTLQRTGAAQNAYTSDDLTCYHTLFGKDDLETWLRLEADRFQHLEYPENQFKDESRAVLGEYNKNSANPISKLFEVQRDAAFTSHTYKHTTMGFLRDIEDMPNQFQYSLEFFKRWYRPDNVTVILTGDVTPEKVFPLVEKYFGVWKRGKGKAPAVPAEPQHSAPVAAHVAWETPTLPWMSVAFHTPAKFSTVNNDAVALELAGQLLFGPQSELYQRLVVKEQKVDQFFAGGGDSKDPELFTIAARVKKLEDLAYVRDAILDACAGALAVPFSATRLAEAKTEARLAFARAMDSTDRIAGMAARMACYDRDPEALNKVPMLREGVTVADLARIAKATFQDRNRVLTTLCQGPLPEPLKAAFAGVDARAALLAQVPALPLLEEPSQSPLLNLRLRFAAGSSQDPAGREGLSALAAAMISNAGTARRSLAEVLKAESADGGGLGSLVDKESTSFALTVPRIKAAEALELALEQLTSPGFRDEDFARLKSQQQNALKVGLKANNDEELGKLSLEGQMYAEPYAHPVLGSERGLAAITLEDVKGFVKERYTRKNLLAGLGGGFNAEDKAQLLRGLAALPDTLPAPTALPQAPDLASSHLHIVQKDTRATAISFGFPLRVDRRHPDFAALWVATTFLGDHRNSTGQLYQRLRELRGLNYGDYAYLEAFPMGMFKTQRDPGTLRSLNHFQIWIRPVAPQNGAFALKGAIFELDHLAKQGLTDAQFQATRTYLVKFLDHLTDTGGKRLGHDLDMRALGFDKGFVETLRARLQALTLEGANASVKKHLRATGLDIVAVAKDPEALKRDLLAPACPIPAYQSPKPELKAEDEAISSLKLDVQPEHITVTPLAEEFR